MTKPSPIFVNTQAGWNEAAERLARSPFLAVDLEGNGFFRYPERVCLVQIGTADQIILLDPLSVKNLHALETLLIDDQHEKIFHSCDWDLRVLQRDFGFRVRNLFDTSVAARFLGLNQAGLGNVLKTYLEVEVNKSKSLQRQDWTLRPLPPESIAYAADDVWYLRRLREHMYTRLRELERWDWVCEEFLRIEAMKFTAPVSPEEAFWNVKGSRGLAPEQRTCLRELYLFRDRLARQLDRPPFKLVSDQVLLDLAMGPDQPLEKVSGLNYVSHLGRLTEIRQLLHQAAKLPGLPLPKAQKDFPYRMNAEAKFRFMALKAWRQAKGTALLLDPSLLWPMRSLEFLALHPGKRRQEFDRTHGSEVRAWQVKAFGEELEGLFREWERQKAAKIHVPETPDTAVPGSN
jgi:ribonuclease D